MTLSVAGAARRLGVHANTLRAWTDQGRLPCLRINRRGDRRYRAEDLEAFLREARSPAGPAATAATAGGDRTRRRQHLSPRRRDVERVEVELFSHLDPEQVMRRFMRGARELFGADRAAIFHLLGDGRAAIGASEGLADEAVQGLARLVEPERSVLIPDASQRGSAGAREGLARQALGSVVLTPLRGGERPAYLALGRDRPRPWSWAGLRELESLAARAEVALRNARNYRRMETWTAQLQSIQQLGTRLNRLSTVDGIGQAICAELRQLIDYHNVRVYRIYGDDVVPVAWRGEIGEYTDENVDQLSLRVGHGITGWVAQHGLAQYLPDAARDPRSATIPGTEDGLDESLLLAPMLYEDRVIGVIVLAKLGLDRFTLDDLRYLEIYASIAAQAMVNADATERLRAQSSALEHQLESQRELLRITESILSNLDPGAVVAEIADRLGGLVPVDNLGIDVHDPEAGLLRPLLARGVHADQYLRRTIPDDRGVAGWVVHHGEAQLVQDQRGDERVAHLPELGPEPGALIVAPLRARDRVLGVLTLERLGETAAFGVHEFELIRLFAGHVSIALQNALAHQAVEIRAQTDALTGLKNHGTFMDELAAAIERQTPFSLLMIDLDEFKAFNDRRGHEAGNMLLRSISSALEAACRESDEVYRYGGDEFAIVLSQTLGDDALEVASRLNRAVAETPDPGTRRASGMRCSVGLASFPRDAGDGRGLLLAADRACYAAKRSGGDRVATATDGLALAAEFQPDATPQTERRARSSAA